MICKKFFIFKKKNFFFWKDFLEIKKNFLNEKFLIEIIEINFQSLIFKD